MSKIDRWRRVNVGLEEEVLLKGRFGVEFGYSVKLFHGLDRCWVCTASASEMKEQLEEYCEQENFHWPIETFVEQQSELDAERLAKSAGFEFVLGRLVAFDASRGSFQYVEAVGDGDANDDNRSIVINIGKDDLASIDIGSTVLGLRDVPGVAEFSVATRPITQLTTKLLNWQPAPSSVLVVGGGTAGCELAFCTHWRWIEAGARVTLVDSHDRLLGPRARPNVEAKVRAALQRRNIELLLQHRVTALPKANTATIVDSASGARADRHFDLIIWATGACAHPISTSLISTPATGKEEQEEEQEEEEEEESTTTTAAPDSSGSGVLLDDRGFFLTEDTLQLVGVNNVFACGDCGTLTNHRHTPKAGVYAVREAPVLIHNLWARMTEGAAARLQPYTPQSDFLSLINLGAGQAIGTKYGFTLESHIMWMLKDKIDRGFMEKYGRV